MIDHNENPDFLNDFLDYSATILNKSPNSIKEYNYDIAYFLKFIVYKFNLATISDEEDLRSLSIKDLNLNDEIKLSMVDGEISCRVNGDLYEIR